jgi:hypothetical protein
MARCMSGLLEAAQGGAAPGSHLLLHALRDVDLVPHAVDAHVGWVGLDGQPAQAAQPASR